MNIFALDLNPGKAAEYHCDKHVIKMIIETAQILASNQYIGNGILSKKEALKYQERVKEIFKGFPRKQADGSIHPYGLGFRYHPCTVWARQSRENRQWLIELGLALSSEYTRRWHKIHQVQSILKWFQENPLDLPDLGLTPFAQAMPDECKNPDPVKAYRDYYIKYKSRFAKWKTGAPEWFLRGIQEIQEIHKDKLENSILINS